MSLFKLFMERPFITIQQIAFQINVAKCLDIVVK